MCDDPNNLLILPPVYPCISLISDDRATAEAMLSIQKSGGAVRTVRSDAGVQFVSGGIRLDGTVVADLINLKWIIPDGPRDYRLFETLEDF